MVRLQPADGDHRIHAFGPSLAQQELELAQLVPAPTQAHVIVAFNVNFDTAPRAPEALLRPKKPLDRRDPVEQCLVWMTERGQAMNGHG